MVQAYRFKLVVCQSLRPPRSPVFISVCSQLCTRTTERIFTKILPPMYLCTSKNWLNFGSHPPPDPDPGIFWRILQHCEIGHFSTTSLGLYLRRKCSDFHKNCSLSQMYPWTRKFSLNFGNNPDPDTDSGSRPHSPWWMYAVSDCSCSYLVDWLSAVYISIMAHQAQNTHSALYNWVTLSRQKKLNHFQELATRGIGHKRRSTSQNVQYIIWSRTCCLKFYPWLNILCTSPVKQHCTKNNDSPFMCNGHVPDLQPTGHHRSAEWSMYQNVQYIIRSKTAVLNFITARYSLHKCSETILCWR